MAKNSVSECIIGPHSLIVKERKQTEITGISEVCAFDERQVYMKTVCGAMRITGKDLKVTSLLPDKSSAVIEGMIDSIQYTGIKPLNILKRKMK